MQETAISSSLKRVVWDLSTTERETQLVENFHKC